MPEKQCSFYWLHRQKQLIFLCAKVRASSWIIYFLWCSRLSFLPSSKHHKKQKPKNT